MWIDELSNRRGDVVGCDHMGLDGRDLFNRHLGCLLGSDGISLGPRKEKEVMATPRERLEKAAHGLAREAQFIEDITIETRNGSVMNGQGEVGRTLLVQALEAVRRYSHEIEEIVK